MTDLVMRSGRCHGPDCHRMITDRDRSPDFCSEECQTHWHRLWTRGTAVTKGWVPQPVLHVGQRAPGDRTIYPLDVDPLMAVTLARWAFQAPTPAQPVHQTNRSWSERLTGWWRPNG